MSNKINKQDHAHRTFLVRLIKGVSGIKYYIAKRAYNWNNFSYLTQIVDSVSTFIRALVPVLR